METLFYRNKSFCYFFCLYEKPSDVKCIIFSNVFVNKSNIYKWTLTKTIPEIKEIMENNCSLEEDEKGYFVNFEYECEKYFSLSNYCKTNCHRDNRKTNRCPANVFTTLKTAVDEINTNYCERDNLKNELEKAYNSYLNFLTYHIDFVIPIEQPMYRTEESCVQKNKKDFISILNEDDVKSQMIKLKEDIILSQLTS